MLGLALVGDGGFSMTDKVCVVLELCVKKILLEPLQNIK